MLSNDQKERFRAAINNYDFPCVAFDYENQVALNMTTIYEIEQFIRNQLVSNNVESIKDGLSNVLYWGYATSGYRDFRVNKFRQNVTETQLIATMLLLADNQKPTISELNKISMPQYSGISFLSKIRMFLSPQDSATLDKQIMKIKFTNFGQQTVLDQFSHSNKEGQIRPSRPNSVAYEAWCERLIEISNTYFDGQYRAVDIERGMFKLIREGNTTYSAEILANA